MNKLSLDELEDPGNTDEDFFGNLSARSNLGQLFGVGIKAEEENQTLKYRPAKKKLEQAVMGTVISKETTSSWQTELAKVVNAYKAGDSIGKVGAALLQNTEGGWKMILYKTRAQVLSTVTLLPQANGFKELHLQSRYLQYYDDENIYWSLLFDKQEDEFEFLEKLQALGIALRGKQITSDEKEKQLPSIFSESQNPSKLVETPAKLEEPSELLKAPLKSTLITRMAKMGQQLPKFRAAASTEYSDSSDTEVLATPGALNSIKPTIAPRFARSVASVKNELVSLDESNNAKAANTATCYGKEVQIIQMFLSENRMQNSEMRMNMNKLEGKLEKVLDKFDTLNSGGVGPQNNKEDELLELEEKLLELKKENRKLKQMAERGNQNCEAELQTRVLREYNKELEALDLGQVYNLSQLLSGLLDRIATLQTSVKRSETKLDTTEQNIKSQELKWETKSAAYAKERSQNEELVGQLEKLNQELRNKEVEYRKTEKKLLEEKEQLASRLVEEQAKTPSLVKNIMNSLYGNVASKLEVMQPVNKNAVLALLGKTIKEETLRAIDKSQQ